jgi:hypothetical protein
MTDTGYRARNKPNKYAKALITLGISRGNFNKQRKLLKYVPTGKVKILYNK